MDDIYEAVAYLKKKGVTVLGEPMEMSEGPSAGETWAYFLAPWRMQLELVSYEKGKTHEKTTDKKAFKP